MLTRRREIHSCSCQDAPLPEPDRSRYSLRMTTGIHQTCSPLSRCYLREQPHPRLKTCWRRLLQSLRCPIPISTATPRATIGITYRQPFQNHFISYRRQFRNTSYPSPHMSSVTSMPANGGEPLPSANAHRPTPDQRQQWRMRRRLL